MLCHNFLIGKGHTCALRTTCVLVKAKHYYEQASRAALGGCWAQLQQLRPRLLETQGINDFLAIFNDVVCSVAVNAALSGHGLGGIAAQWAIQHDGNTLVNQGVVALIDRRCRNSMNDLRQGAWCVVCGGDGS